MQWGGSGGKLSSSTTISDGNVKTAVEPAAGIGLGTSAAATVNITVELGTPKPPWSPLDQPRIGTGDAFASWYGLR